MRMHTVMYWGLALLITVGSRFDDWVYWTLLLQFHLITTAHTLSSFLTTSALQISFSRVVLGLVFVSLILDLDL
jgi:hypothetical protein